jgi:hypothetical protein
VLTGDGTGAARAVLVATDPVTAGDLLPGLDVPEMHALTTYFHVAPNPPASAPMLHLDGTGGPVANSIVLTEAAPGYAPDDRSLIASTVLGDADHVPEAAVRGELARLYAVPTHHWAHLHTAEIRRALPAFRPGRPVRSPIELGDGIFVAGDHRDTPSTQGALVSGRRAAEAIATALGVA